MISPGINGHSCMNPLKHRCLKAYVRHVLTITERCILPTQRSYGLHLIPETAGISPFFIFLKCLIAQRVYAVCTGIIYRIVPVTNLKKYLHCGTSGTE